MILSHRSGFTLVVADRLPFIPLPFPPVCLVFAYDSHDSTAWIEFPRMWSAFQLEEQIRFRPSHLEEPQVRFHSQSDIKVPSGCQTALSMLGLDLFRIERACEIIWGDMCTCDTESLGWWIDTAGRGWWLVTVITKKKIVCNDCQTKTKYDENFTHRFALTWRLWISADNVLFFLVSLLTALIPAWQVGLEEP